MRIPLLVAAAAVTAFVAGSAMAQPPGGGRGLPPFAAMDANKDGKVTKDEFKAALPAEFPADRVDTAFDRRDANHDGSISAEEYAAAPAGRGGGGGGGGAPAPAPAPK